MTNCRHCRQHSCPMAGALAFAEMLIRELTAAARAGDDAEFIDDITGEAYAFGGWLDADKIAPELARQNLLANSLAGALTSRKLI